jgi:hypothetical protein
MEDYYYYYYYYFYHYYRYSLNYLYYICCLSHCSLAIANGHHRPRCVRWSSHLRSLNLIAVADIDAGPRSCSAAAAGDAPLPPAMSATLPIAIELMNHFGSAINLGYRRRVAIEMSLQSGTKAHFNIIIHAAHTRARIKERNPIWEMGQLRSGKWGSLRWKCVYTKKERRGRKKETQRQYMYTHGWVENKWINERDREEDTEREREREGKNNYIEI